MFTGIISANGRIDKIAPLAAGLRLTIAAPAAWLKDVAIGDSIAHNGVCLTVIAKQAADYQVEVSRESLECTVGLDTADNELNLEKALRLKDFVGGHLVSGHVDAVGRVVKFAPRGESYELVVRAPKRLTRFIAVKGSITIDGVSLTVNRVFGKQGRKFSINLIPHTLAVTTLRRLQAGSRVNLEIDLLARYAEKLERCAR